VPTLNEGLVRRINFGSRGWQWLVSLVVLYAVPTLLAWRDGSLSPSVLVLSLILASALIALSEFDRQTFRLPDVITIPLGVSGILAAAIVGGDVLWHVLSAGVGLVVTVLVDCVYRAWRGFSGIGLGDAKLLAASGAWLGAEALPTVLLWSCSAALVVMALAHALGRQIGAQTAIPFGSFLAFGTWLVWCLGPLH